MSTSFSAKNFMISTLVTFSPHMDVTDAIHELVKEGVSGAPVVDEKGSLVGILTERDCLDAFLKASYYSEPAGPVSEFMSRDVKTVDADESIIQVAQRLAQTKYRRYPVLQSDRLVGMLGRREVLRAMLEVSSSQLPNH